MVYVCVRFSVTTSGGRIAVIISLPFGDHIILVWNILWARHASNWFVFYLSKALILDVRCEFFFNKCLVFILNLLVCQEITQQMVSDCFVFYTYTY